MQTDSTRFHKMPQTCAVSTGCEQSAGVSKEKDQSKSYRLGTRLEDLVNKQMVRLRAMNVQQDLPRFVRAAVLKFLMLEDQEQKEAIHGQEGLYDSIELRSDVVERTSHIEQSGQSETGGRRRAGSSGRK